MQGRTKSSAMVGLPMYGVLNGAHGGVDMLPKLGYF